MKKYKKRNQTTKTTLRPVQFSEYSVPVDVELYVKVLAKDSKAAEERAEEIIYTRFNNGTVQITSITAFNPAEN